MPIYVVSMVALVQLIFKGPPVNTHFQRKAFCVTTVASLFIAVLSFLLLLFFLLDSLVSLCAEDVSFQPSAYVIFHWQRMFVAAGLAVVTNLYSGALILIQCTFLCCPLTSVCIWLSQGDGPQHVL